MLCDSDSYHMTSFSESKVMRIRGLKERITRFTRKKKILKKAKAMNSVRLASPA